MTHQQTGRRKLTEAQRRFLDRVNACTDPDGLPFDGRKYVSTQISLRNRGLITCIVPGGTHKPRAFITEAGRTALAEG